MRFESFRHLAQVAQAGSFYAAAEEVYISQQGLNKSVTALENELGMQLLVRDRKGVRLTPAGEVVVRYEQQLRDGYRQMIDELATLDLSQGAPDTRLKVHATYYPVQLVAALNTQIRALERYTVIEEPFKKIIQDARESDGSELYVLDASTKTLQDLKAYPELVFRPLFVTQYGIVWRDGNALQGQEKIHRQTVQKMPMGVNTFRDMAKLTEWIFRDFPLQNVRLAASYPRMLLDFVATSPENVATFDSFGMHLSRQDPSMSTQNVNYTPLSTPDGMFTVGFLRNKKAKTKPQATRAMDKIAEFMYQAFPDYFEKYPVS